MGAAAITGAGDARSACRLRHVVKMFPSAFWLETCGGLAGGEAKSADWSRVRGGCDESQAKAEGNSMVTGRATQASDSVCIL